MYLMQHIIAVNQHRQQDQCRQHGQKQQAHHHHNNKKNNNKMKNTRTGRKILTQDRSSRGKPQTA